MPSATPRAVPSNAFQQTILLAYTDDYEAGTGTASVRLAYAFGAGIQPPMLRGLDAKLDDGSPVTGVMRPTVSTANTGETGTDMGAALIWIGTPVCVTGEGIAAAIYNVDSDNTSCNAVILD